MTGFNEVSFPFTDDQIQQILYDLIYDSGLSPIGKNIPNLQDYLAKYNLKLEMI